MDLTPTPTTTTTTTAVASAAGSSTNTTATTSPSVSHTSHPHPHPQRTLSHLSIPHSPQPPPSSHPTTTQRPLSTSPSSQAQAKSTGADSSYASDEDKAYYTSLPINVSPSVTPSSPLSEQPVIGLIGMGAMGRMYASALSEAGWGKINVCDLPERYESLKEEWEGKGKGRVTVMIDGHAVSRSSDFIVYSVEAEFVDRVVRMYGPSTKVNAIVAGQTSVKAPEKEAFEKYLPRDVHIVSCHSLHGPSVSPLGQPLIIIRHRSSADAVTLVEAILRPLRSRHVHLSYAEHDVITASTQAVTHAAFLSMGSAWSAAKSYPWEEGWYVGGIETAKVNLTLRIYSNSWHVYAGLAILNPEGKRGIERYAQSAGELFKLMIAAGGDPQSTHHQSAARQRFRERVEWARDKVFGRENLRRRPILLSEDVLDRFSLGKVPEVDCASGSAQSQGCGGPAAGCCADGQVASISPSPNDNLSPHSPTHPPSKYRPNSHLSLLAMVDCWAHLAINPYEHLELAATPLFRLFLGVAEWLFLAPAHDLATKSVTPLSQAIHSALYDTWHRSDDLEFVIAARGWSQAVSFGSFEVYKRRFEETRGWFEREGRFDDGEVQRVGNEMIKAVMESEVLREEEQGVGLRGESMGIVNKEK